MADGVTAPILNPESVSLYDEQYEVGPYAADTCQKMRLGLVMLQTHARR